MSIDIDKKIKQIEYRASAAEAELVYIRRSRAYKIARILGIVKNKIKKDPVGLLKKATVLAFNEPKKIVRVIMRTKRADVSIQASVNQNNKYQEWILLNEPNDSDINNQKKQSDLFIKRPLISIVTPVFNPPVDVLDDLIKSVLDQTYSNFELCLGDFGDSLEVKSLLLNYSSIDKRIKYKSFKDNLGISGNSNQILKGMVKGEYIALLDHDDTLSPDALYENVKAINDGDYDFIYSDKDKIDIAGNRFEPLFKPQFSPEMMLNINYLTHLNVMRTSIIRKIGGWDSKTDGAQDWDIFLRFVDFSDKIFHIPKILYHWRVIASSTAMSIETKPYALAGQRLAAKKHLDKNNTKADPYHRHTEMLLSWSDESVDRNPVFYIYFSNMFNTKRLIRSVKKSTESVKFVVLVCSPLDPDNYSLSELTNIDSDITVINYSAKDFYKIMAKSLRNLANKNAVFIRDSIRLSAKDDWYGNLTGWLSIDDVAAVSGRVLDKNDIILDSGAVISGKGFYYPIFKDKPKYFQGYIGNAEWVRDLSIISSNFFATKVDLLIKYNFSKKVQRNIDLDDYFLWLNNRYRIVLNPGAIGVMDFYDKSNFNLEHKLIGIRNKGGYYVDKFSNPNMNESNPFDLIANESSCAHGGHSITVDKYQNDSIILANSFDISEDELVANKRLIESYSVDSALNTAAWFLPSYDAVYAGLMNIFRFANFLSETKGLKTTFYILKNSDDASNEKKHAVKAFPYLKNATFLGIRPDQVSEIKKHDIGIATLWSTAYPLAKTLNIKRKMYFIQDNEVNFYPKGTISSLVDLTYSFGFTAIANTEGLLDLYRNKYKGDGFVVKSYVDLTAYYPRDEVYYVPGKPYRVFFYSRPNMPRNAFELGIAGLKKLKEQLRDDVEIITAGEQWDAASYGVEGLFTNLGKIEYSSVPKLYRSVDVGLMFMFSGHPGVTASELMASGCPVVVNEYDDVTWHELYKDEITCLVTKPTASEVARNIRRCIEDNDLRRKIIDNGLSITKKFYSNYDESCEYAFGKIINR
jgi:hypothetical protein